MAMMTSATLLPRLTRRPSCTRIASEYSPLTDAESFPSIMTAVNPSVVSLVSGREMARSTGVFVDTRLIVTTARSVGAVSTAYDYGRNTVVHSCHVSRTIALTERGRALRTRPVAVHFAGDLAVLEVSEAEVEAEEKFPTPIAVANNLSEEDGPLFTLAVREEYVEDVLLDGKLIRLTGGVVKTERQKAPWPLEEELGWFDFGFSPKNVGAGGRVAVQNFSGSPWFNNRKEVAGVASWAAPDTYGVMKSYAVPPLRIKSVLDYARNKGNQDPIVMDRWIKDTTISDRWIEEEEEAIPPWPKHIVMHTGHNTMSTLEW